MPDKKLWVILVPTLINNKPVRTRYHRVWDARVKEIANGLTIFHPTKGYWVDKEGTLFEERMIPVQIACSEEEIELIASMTAKYYKQKAIMFYLVSNDVRIREFPDQES